MNENSPAVFCFFKLFFKVPGCISSYAKIPLRAHACSRQCGFVLKKKKKKLVQPLLNGRWLTSGVWRNKLVTQKGFDNPGCYVVQNPRIYLRHQMPVGFFFF